MQIIVLFCSVTESYFFVGFFSYSPSLVPVFENTVR